MKIPSLRHLEVAVALGVLAFPMHAQTTTRDSLNRLLAVIPDSQLRRLLQTASQSGVSSSLLVRLFSYDTPVVALQTTGVNFPRRQVRPPRIDDSVLADVRPFSTNPIAEYRGGYLVTEAALGHITGRLDSIATPFELYYKLPDNGQLSNIRPGARLQLRLIDDAYGMSLRRTVFLSTATGAPLLLYYSDGGYAPHRLTLEDPPLQITQRQVTADAPYVVVVSLAGQTTRGLRAGERASVATPTQRFNVVTLESAAAPRRLPGAEGDSYHVTVLIYALP